MPYTIQAISPKQWEAFIKTQPFHLFVQAPEVCNFYDLEGEQAWLWGIFDQDTLVGGTLVASTHAKRGNFLFLPYGPLIDESSKKKAALAALTQHLSAFAKKEGYQFIRVSPFWRDSEDVRAMFAHLGYRPAPMHVLAEHTWLLDLRAEEESILAAMKKNHRNLIRRCEREGVRVEMDTSEEAVTEFNDILDETAKRHNFHRFPRTYIEHEVDVFRKTGKVQVFRAYLPDGTLEASCIVVYYHNMAAYHHGASYGKNKRLPASYLMQWRAIQEAKRRGCRWYNFWGIAPDGASKDHPFYGITHFKKGFGGSDHVLVPCQDYPVSLRYHLTRWFELLRKHKRGFS